MAAKGDRLEALYSVALTLGLRQGEALGLRWQDVDVQLGYLRIARQLQRIDGAFQLVEPKTARSRRTIVMPPSVAKVLDQHCARQQMERTNAGRNGKNGVWCLRARTAIPWTGQSSRINSTGSSNALEFRSGGSMTSGIPAQVCCWPRESRRGWSWKYSATPRSR
jgi:integrase